MPTTVARSIGSKAQYSTGTISVDATGLIITLSGGTFDADWGRGDKLVIDTGGTPETRYVLTRDSGTQLTLQTASTRTSESGLNFTIDRVYAVVSTFESTEQRDIVAADQIAEATMYDDGEFVDYSEWTGWTTDDTRYILVTVPVGQRHDGKRYNTSGARMKNDSADVNVSLFAITSGSSVRLDVEWLMLKLNSGNGGSCVVNSGGASSSRLRVRNCIGTMDSDHGGTEIAFRVLNSNSVIMNSYAYGGSLDGGVEVGNSAQCYNCTVYKCDGGASQGVSANTAGTIVKNTISLSCGTNWDTGFGTASHNMGESGDTIPGGNSQTSTAGCEFVSITPGSEDLQLKVCAVAIHNGTDLGATPTGVNIDILGRDRDSEGDVWDMGAHEFVSIDGDVPPKYMHLYRQRVQ